MKKLAMMFLLLTINCYGEELRHYNQIRDAIMHGEQIHIVVNYSHCITSASKNASPGFSGYYSPTEIAVDDTNKQIAAASKHFTIDDPMFMGRAIYEFARYTISSNDTLEMWWVPLDAVNYTQLDNKMTYSCQLGKDAKVFD